MGPLPRITVVVPARPDEPTLAACVAAIESQEPPPHELLVEVDRAGEGPAAVRNRACGRASGDLLAFTDADCVPAPGWLDALGSAARDDGADLLQGCVLPPDGVRVGPWDRFIWVAGPHGLHETANLAVRRELFEAIGGFESVARPRGGAKELGEDAWLGWRARRAGARFAFVPGALVHHAVHPRTYGGWLAERARLRFFPVLVHRMPELRDAFLWRGCFLTRRSAEFDLALAGALTRRPILAAPYAVTLVRDARRWGPRAAAGRAIGDAAGFAALAAGSVRARTLVL